ncbi:hypothetical protein Csa_013157 [Cucumis sativus]|uniref:Uncharacterized protein n=1 Tax=Cucumis sativus TaxID=3659 RepID=A0A0A0LR94_CUCSA|nr:hypothetical protein Csa_013157 [Cucumis sativus]
MNCSRKSYLWFDVSMKLADSEQMQMNSSMRYGCIPENKSFNADDSICWKRYHELQHNSHKACNFYIKSTSLRRIQ